MKSINLKSLIEIYNHNKAVCCFKKGYFNFYGTKIKTVDIETLKQLLSEIQLEEVTFFNDFFFGYSIPQIGKEFDLLRFAENSILNIELKSEYTEKIQKQLLKNKYYLKFLNKLMYLYTYVAKDNTLWKLNDNDELIQCELQEVVNILKTQINDILLNENPDKIFIPSNYLISPFNKTHAFINGEYFLTKEQEEIEKDILKRIKNNEKAFLITGGAGSGKTLLTYHLAKELQEKNNKVAIIHMGNLNFGHDKLKEEFNWNIQSIKYWKWIFKDYIPDVIIIDEVQRANNKNQFLEIINYVKQNNIILIMSGDKNQTFRKEEGWAIEWKNINTYKLNEKIRTNKELSSFIKVLLDLKRKRDIKPSDQNINITYFDFLSEAKQYILNKKDYTYISYTPNTGKFGDLCEMHKLNFSNVGTAHQVIGQEFENVITILDKNFYYDEQKKLLSNKVTHNPYSLRKMFFQQITRAINKLEIVVVENIALYNKIMSIFE